MDAERCSRKLDEEAVAGRAINDQSTVVKDEDGVVLP